MLQNYLNCFLSLKYCNFTLLEPAALQNLQTALNSQGVEITWDSLEGYADAIVLEYEINNAEFDVRKCKSSNF